MFQRLKRMVKQIDGVKIIAGTIVFGGGVAQAAAIVNVLYTIDKNQAEIKRLKAELDTPTLEEE